MKGRRNTHGVAGIGGSGAPSPFTPAPSRRGVEGTILGLPSSFTVASLPSRPRGAPSTRSAAKVPGRGAACHRRWRLRWGLAPVARAPEPGAGTTRRRRKRRVLFLVTAPTGRRPAWAPSRSSGPARRLRRLLLDGLGAGTSSATKRSNLLLNEAVPAVLHGVVRAAGQHSEISAQRLPRLWCSTSIVLTSSTVKGALETADRAGCATALDTAFRSYRAWPRLLWAISSVLSLGPVS